MNKESEKVFTERGFTNIEQMAIMFDWYKEEIERLKEEYMILQNASDEVEEELQQRIDKAIEYIENKNKYLDSENYYQVFEYRDIYLKPLLDILKGVDKE